MSANQVERELHLLLREAGWHPEGVLHVLFIFIRKNKSSNEQLYR